MKKFILLNILFTCLLSVYAQPANDNPCNATAITVASGATCTPSSTPYTTAAATATPSIPVPTCGSTGYSKDVWFSFVAPASGVVYITTTAGTMTDATMQLLSVTSAGACPGTPPTLAAVACDDDLGPGNMPELVSVTVIPGNTYYLRVYPYSTSTTVGTFGLCISDATNPACASFSLTTPTNGATGVSVPPNLAWTSVAGATKYDVYVSTTNTFPNTYDFRGTTLTPSAIVMGLSGLTTYYWKVVAKNASNAVICTSSTFSFTTATVSGVPIGEACSNPIPVNSNGNYIGSLCNSGCQSANDPAMGNIASAFCGFADNLMFLQFTASATTANFTMNSSSYANLQVDLLQVTGGCTGTWSHAGTTPCYNSPTNSSISFGGLTIGNTYYIVIDNQSGSVTEWSFTATSGVLVCNISAVAVANIGACNDNGTNTNITDDYYTADVTVTYANKPTTGTLALSGTGIHSGTYSVAVASAGTTSYTFTNVKIKANGNIQSITATFSSSPTCTFTNATISAVNSCSVPCAASSSMIWNP